MRLAGLERSLGEEAVDTLVMSLVALIGRPPPNASWLQNLQVHVATSGVSSQPAMSMSVCNLPRMDNSLLANLQNSCQWFMAFGLNAIQKWLQAVRYFVFYLKLV